MTAPLRIDLVTARRMAIEAQRLSGPARRSSPTAVLDLMRQIRCVQLDPISVVARSPLLVLRSRLSGLRPAHLDRLAYRDRSLFEYWAHAASIVLAEDYAIHRYLMRVWPGTRPYADRIRGWLRANDKLRRSVLSDLRRRGPLRIRDLTDHAVESWVSSGWTRDRNVDQMVRFLWVMGKVMVADRKGLEKWWDLAERVLSADVRSARALRDIEVTRRAAQLSLRGLGVATAAHIKGHFTVERYPELPRVLAELERAGTIERVEVVRDGAALPGPWFVHAEDLPVLERIEGGTWRPRTTLLSPFDNLIHDRKRSLTLFDLDYRMEIYIPKAERRFGYYAMPLLHGDRFVARVDPAVDRERGVLVLNAVHSEDGVRPDRGLGPVVADAVHELAGWAGATSVEVAGHVPSSWRTVRSSPGGMPGRTSKTPRRRTEGAVQRGPSS